MKVFLFYYYCLSHSFIISHIFFTIPTSLSLIPSPSLPSLSISLSLLSSSPGTRATKTGPEASLWSPSRRRQRISPTTPQHPRWTGCKGRSWHAETCFDRKKHCKGEKTTTPRECSEQNKGDRCLWYIFSLLLLMRELFLFFISSSYLSLFSQFFTCLSYTFSNILILYLLFLSSLFSLFLLFFISRKTCLKERESEKQPVSLKKKRRELQRRGDR